jgi:hypothetical protein
MASLRRAVHRCALAAVIAAAVVLLGVAPAPAATLIHDEFNDGDIATNTLSPAIGGPYRASIWRGTHSEDTAGVSEYVVERTGQWGNGGLFAVGADNPDHALPVWSSDGVTGTAKMGKAVATDGAGINTGFSFQHKSNVDPDDDFNTWNAQNGGIWLRLNVTSDPDGPGGVSVDGAIIAASSGSPGESSDDVVTVARFVVSGWDAQDFRTFQLCADDTGWQAYVQGQVSWEDALDSSVMPGNVYGQSWSYVNANAGFTLGQLDASVFDDAGDGSHFGVGLYGADGKGVMRYDSILVETGNQLLPEPGTLSLLLLGTIGLLRNARGRN